MRFLAEPEFRARRQPKNGENSAIRGRNDHVIPRGRPALRVAEKCDNPDHERQADPAGPPRERKKQGIRKSGHGDERPAGPMNNELLQIVTCVPISTTRLGGSR